MPSLCTLEEQRFRSSCLNLGIRWRWVTSFTFQPLYSQGRSHRYILDRGLGGTQRRPGHFVRGKFPCFCRKSNHDSSISQLVAQSLCRTKSTRPKIKLYWINTNYYLLYEMFFVNLQNLQLPEYLTNILCGSLNIVINKFYILNLCDYILLRTHFPASLKL
jgi:hypothetical protein